MRHAHRLPEVRQPDRAGERLLRELRRGAWRRGAVKSTPSANTEALKERSIVVAILLSIVTCGIYGIYWFICLTDDMNRAAGRENDTNGVTAFLLAYFAASEVKYIRQGNGRLGRWEILLLVELFLALAFGILRNIFPL